MKPPLRSFTLHNSAFYCSWVRIQRGLTLRYFAFLRLFACYVYRTYVTYDQILDLRKVPTGITTRQIDRYADSVYMTCSGIAWHSAIRHRPAPTDTKINDTEFQLHNYSILYEDAGHSKQTVADFFLPLEGISLYFWRAFIIFHKHCMCIPT